MVEPHRDVPIPFCLTTIQFSQMARGEISIHLGVERVFERRKCMSVHHEIDLQASYIDIVVPERLLVYPRDGRILTVQEERITIGIDGPWPGTQIGGSSYRPGAFSSCDRFQYTGRKMMPVFGLTNGWIA
ncbi:MAG: hypothetical protein JO227_11200 [Acetobacteraceae bacterium]|nr:hypothetical protein [Acetobacteraceae bacterium]